MSNLRPAPPPQDEIEVVARAGQPGSRYIRMRPQQQLPDTLTEQPHHIRLTEEGFTAERKSFWQGLRTTIIGKPIPTEKAIFERIGKAKALAVLSSDALSSVAYGTEASLAVLVTAGLTSSAHNLLLGGLIVLLLAIVAFSYRQTIFHYPNGGGSYIVAKEILNVHFGLVAAAALLIDYVLTVSVSVSAGVDALDSAFNGLSSYAVPIGVVLIACIVLINLRGVRESGSIFMAPTYLFVASFMVMLIIGIVQAITHGGIMHARPPEATNIPVTAHLSVILILTAFASGCSAMTGTEAISNGVPIFKARQEVNAAQTLTWMAVILGVMYAGTTYLAWRYGISPQANSNPTVISQLASLFFTGWFGWFYYVFQFATTLILVLAANTSFADFPRLSSLLARDNYLPHLFSMQGDRLAFNTGILVLGVLSSILLIIFHGSTDALINLYALGVFIAFTLSQGGMVRRWLRTKEPGWPRGLAINAIGTVATGIVAVVIAITKFDRGAWVVVILMPILYFLFVSIHRHYQRVSNVAASIPVRVPTMGQHIVVVPIAKVDNLALRGLTYARRLSSQVLAVHVAMTPEEVEEVQKDWDRLLQEQKFLRMRPIIEDLLSDEDPADEEANDNPLQGSIHGLELVIIESPYRALTRPILRFVDALQKAHPDDVITVVLPEFVATHFWEALLHNQTVLRLKLSLLGRPRIVTANVPYRMEDVAPPPKVAQ